MCKEEGLDFEVDGCSNRIGINYEKPLFAILLLKNLWRMASSFSLRFLVSLHFRFEDVGHIAVRL